MTMMISSEISTQSD